MLAVLSADSMEGRGTATPGSARAARWIVERMREYGLEPGVDGGYATRSDGREPGAGRRARAQAAG
jgi:uncharacterized membrane protein